MATYKQAISLDPDLATAHYNLGHAYHKHGKVHLAIAAYQQALATDTELAIAHNNIAVCYTELKMDLDKALSHARTAVRLAPTEANYWDTLSEVCDALGLENEARRAREKQKEYSKNK